MGPKESGRVMEKKTILVVDDEKEIVNAIKQELEESHYEVLTAYNGLEGLEKARKEGPDLVILDLMLPKIDGYKVCGLLKRDTGYAGIPILMLTAKAHEEDKKLAEVMGADAYLTKPFEREVLFSKIQELIGLPTPNP